jgi:hypothetical protein
MKHIFIYNVYNYTCNVIRANLIVILQLKNGQYRAELAIRLADDILPVEIKDRARTVLEKCRNAADGKLQQIDVICVLKYGRSIAGPLASCTISLLPQREENK